MGQGEREYRGSEREDGGEMRRRENGCACALKTEAVINLDYMYGVFAHFYR